MADLSRPPPVTGYPVPNGHPHHPHPPYAYPPQPYDQPYYPPQRTFNLRRVIFITLIITAIFATILFISYIILRPNLPLGTLTTLMVSNLTVTDLKMSATFTLSLNLINPNKQLSAFYDAITGSVSYKSSVLSLTALPPIAQPPHGRDALNGTVVVSGSYVDDWVKKGVERERGNGSVGFDVRVIARVWFKTGVWRTRRRMMVVLCQGVNVGVDKTGSGTMVGGPRRCRVGFD